MKTMAGNGDANGGGCWQGFIKPSFRSTAVNQSKPLRDFREIATSAYAFITALVVSADAAFRINPGYKTVESVSAASSRSLVNH